MSSRIGAITLDGSPISRADVERADAEELHHAKEREDAARVVASAARDVGDCRLLFEILGLGSDVVAAAASKENSKRRTTAA